MKIETREVYKCEYCKKLYQIKKACEKHETVCTKNPTYLRPCHSCSILTKVNTAIWSGVGDFYGTETKRTVSVLFCKKLDCFIYPPTVAAKGNAFDMGNKENIEMPETCEFHTHESQIYEGEITI